MTVIVNVSDTLAPWSSVAVTVASTSPGATPVIVNWFVAASNATVARAVFAEEALSVRVSSGSGSENVLLTLIVRGVPTVTTTSANGLATVGRAFTRTSNVVDTLAP